ncbi:hypothetical protein [Spiroplasma gladiatoris]|nr:hypothetical protein [Spiroplasma gladiatoris]
MRPEILLHLDKNLKNNYDRVYVTKSLNMCAHDFISFDRKNVSYKCTSCFFSFDFDDFKDYLSFKNRLIKDFDFERAEQELKAKIVKENKKIQILESLKDLYELY